MKLSKETLLLAEIVNYSNKGILAGLGKGEGITKKVKLLQFEVTSDTSLTEVATELGKNGIETGDIVVIPSKVVSILESRFVYGLKIENYAKCISDLNYARTNLKAEGGDPISEKDIVGLDKLDAEKGIGVRYSKDPNDSAKQISDAIFDTTGQKVDVVITDSDSGAKKGLKLINCPTIINTPIGATKGLRLFYCMRVAVAAEIAWNNQENTPLFLVKPYQASRLRKDVGELRYSGFLNGDLENDCKEFLS